MHATGANSSAKIGTWTAVAVTLIPIVCLAVPIYVIRPFRPQDASQLAAALTIRSYGPWLSAIAAFAVLAVMLRFWKMASIWRRILLVILSVITLVAACLTHINIFEVMFQPYPSPAFVQADSVQLDADDKVLSITVNSESRAYPIRTMGYHHIVNDVIGNVPIAVTYCTLCHTGLVWSRLFEGKTLHFRLAGINNGNALMRDEETSSIWQQSTGQAIFGPLKGLQLGLIHSDELTFALWHKEQPHGLVLKPEAQYASEYEDKDWEKHVEKTRTVVDTRQSGISPHELMLGVTIDEKSKAYPVKAILTAKLIQDQIAGLPLLIVVGQDSASIRVFKSLSGKSSITFLPISKTNGAGIMSDIETGSEWNFEGCAINGRLAGQCLERVDANKDYWFDWMNHHPNTLVFHS